MKIPVDGLFFIGMQLVAISNTGKVAVWQSVQKHWQLQDVEPICSYDMAATFLLLGCTNGSIYYIGGCRVCECVSCCGRIILKMCVCVCFTMNSMHVISGLTALISNCTSTQDCLQICKCLCV